MGDFDSVKVGVCDCYWTPQGSGTEVFLGLTKGGVDFAYTPEWYDIQVDRYGKTQADAALTGESVSAKVPLAETDLKKIQMFAHTSIAYGGGRRIAFGRFPGFRLGQKAGTLRLHPIAMGTSRAEDIIIYKAVNKGNLELNYKIDAERMLNCEFIGMICRYRADGNMLFEIGDSTKGFSDGQLSNNLDSNGLPENLGNLVEQSNGYIWATPQQVDSSFTGTDPELRKTQVRSYTSLSGTVYDISSQATFDVDSYFAKSNGQYILTTAGDLSTKVPTKPFVATATNGLVTLKTTEEVKALNLYVYDASTGEIENPDSYRLLREGDYVYAEVGVEWNANATLLKGSMTIKARLEA